MVNNRFSFLILGFVILSCFALLSLASAAPSGATVVKVNSSTGPVDAAGSDAAMAANITDLVLTGKTSTQSWQGYSGNVSGVIQLADGSGKVLYNWSQSSPRGQVYASTNNTVYWTNIQCFNFTANGTYTSEAGNGGQTNLYGTNLSQLQASFNINVNDTDGVNQTFNLIGSGTHSQFFTASNTFTAGKCPNSRIFDNTGAGVAGKFEEVLLYEPVSTSVVFASLLNQDANGYDSRTHDFEMLVLEDGHNADTSSTPYYFFVELQ